MKKEWTEEDFDIMGWHDSYVHSISFPNQELNLTFDIDYIFDWVLNNENNLYSFWVSPCYFTFKNVTDLRLNIDFQDYVGLHIDNIERHSPYLTPNGKLFLWSYKIISNIGEITFKSTGYIMKLKKLPLLSKSQVLPR
ncbi:hypothetical protein Fleli_0157 [Bernardetia litoralis DSM 6794]|uniref:Uncharacterized protein n=1 Tax=Bernardetia litoralis (strain ATCC 23117 / DSM 6794 / NBRC 15988 / NCIMB 1366 / Fx l1 / Sio-4) TaxID=880071 RepID=I4AFC1_BERLS|nr:hypothetical protein [Bernardetia litoralis]AFM02656.1 hypothetical protein Fleli_0157 [Bernardetia litoralis DSM 6794]